MIKILKHLKLKEWLFIALSITFIVIQVWLDLKLPDYMSEITRLITSPGNNTKEIWIQGGYMMAIALTNLVTAIVIGYFMAQVSALVSERLRQAVFLKVDSFSSAEITRFSTESLITRTTNDVSQVQMFITIGVQLIIKAPILAVWAVIKISNTGIEWSIATAVTVGLLLVLIITIMLLVIPKFRIVQKKIDNLTRVSRENLTGVRVVRAYNAEAYQENKFRQVNQDLTNINLFTSKTMSFMMPIMTFLMSSLSLSIFWIGAYLIKDQANPLIQGEIFVNMTIFSQYAMQVIMAFMMLVMIFIILPRTLTSSKRINEVLDTESDIKDGTITESDINKIGEVEFKNVSFKYPNADEYVLNDISFKVNKGETIAFIGSTGSGKSTLINLVPRFYDATSGEILVDGINIKDYKIEALHNKLGYIPQKAALFKGTVMSNINFGQNGKDKPNEADIWQALEIAQGSDFVNELEEKLHANIAQNGTNLSGGQKQRVAIARAVARKPEIFIFDDSFSALDYKTDRLLRSALKNATSGATNLIVAQRIGTIIDADKIIVLESGKIVGVGKHKELLETCSVYQEIAYSQLSKEELA